MDTADERGVIVFEIPRSERDHFWAQLPDKPFWNVTIEPWYKRRTTGQWSQNNHFRGHCRQISVETGNKLSHVVAYVIEQACDMGYPEVINPLNGRLGPKPEQEATTVEASILIEAAHLVAADLGIDLVER